MLGVRPVRAFNCFRRSDASLLTWILLSRTSDLLRSSANGGPWQPAGSVVLFPAASGGSATVIAALFLGISSGFTFAMIGAPLTTRLAQHGVTKSAVTAFALTFLAYNLKFLWAPIIDNVRLPVLGRFGQRRLHPEMSEVSEAIAGCD